MAKPSIATARKPASPATIQKSIDQVRADLSEIQGLFESGNMLVENIEGEFPINAGDERRVFALLTAVIAVCRQGEARAEAANGKLHAIGAALDAVVQPQKGGAGA